MSDSKPLIKAEDVAEVLRDAVALLPGCRDLSGRPLLLLPSKEQALNADHIRRVLTYLFTVPADDVREKGFTIVIDMRGKQTWTNVKSMLSAIDIGSKSAIVFAVFIIKPDKLTEKLKASVSMSSWNFDLKMIAMDQLSRLLDMSQLTREFGGTYPYNHEDWVNTRLELERWIWEISDMMRGLEKQRRSVCEAELPSNITSAKAAISQHTSARNAILATPVDKIQQESLRINNRITKPATGVQNPDLVTVLPHMSNLIASLLDLKDKVYRSWQKRHADLEEIYHVKLYENNVDEMMEWIRSHSQVLINRMGDLGVNEDEAAARLREFEDFETSARNSQGNVGQVTQFATRLINSGTPQHRGRIERSAILVGEDWDRFQTLLDRRRQILNAAIGCFRSCALYFSQLQSWRDQPGCDPSTVDVRNPEQLETAINAHQVFWDNVEGIYAEAVGQGSELTNRLKHADAEDQQGVARDNISRLSRSQKQLHGTWRERQVKLHSLLALTAFQTDTQRVIEWLDEHGDTYLERNTKIGDNLEQAKALQRNHSQFKRIAQNTYANAKKLFDASKMILESGLSGVVDADRMRNMLGDLEMRLQQFTARLEARDTLLRYSVLFRTHFTELLDWYATMEKKYDGTVLQDVDKCEAAKELWVQESDGTQLAFTTTMGEGEQLIKELGELQPLLGIDYSQSIENIKQMMGHINLTHQRLTDGWTLQRTTLQIALSFAHFVRDNDDVLDQIKNWQTDMLGMVASPTFIDNAAKVQRFHSGNTTQVKMAIRNIKRAAQELQQAIHGHQLDTIKTADGKLLLEMIRQYCRELESAEHQVLKVASETAKSIDGAKKLNEVRFLARKLMVHCDDEERRMYARSGIPGSFKEATNALRDHEEFEKTISLAQNECAQTFQMLSNQLVHEGIVDRNMVVELIDVVKQKYSRLLGLSNDRGKMLKCAIAYYKTVVNHVQPILVSLEKEYRSDRFQQGCGYGQKTGEHFLNFIRRANVSEAERDRYLRDIYEKRSSLREHQSVILELWNSKKKHLDRCQQYVLLYASREQIEDWLNGEGRAKLAIFQTHAKNMSSDQTADIQESFKTYIIQVKEKRTNVQTLLAMVKSIYPDAEEHISDIDRCESEIKQSFETFSRQVADCEALLFGSGGRNLPVRDELSLDRHSDNSVEDKLQRQRAETHNNEQMRKMREPMQELMKSERDYIDDLRRCVDIYVHEFDAAAANLPLSLRGKRSDIFGNVEKIYEFHSQKFLRELSKYENDPEEVGCSFNVWVDYLNELYTEYCVNKEQNNQILTTPDAVHYFSSVRVKHGLEINNDLGSLLIKPIQRITRYRLMMEQLLKSCTSFGEVANQEERDKTDRNLVEIREAYEVVLSVPKRVNDRIHLNCLDKEKLDMASFGELVIQDTFTVFEPRSYFKKGKDRQVFLFEFYIVFAKRIDAPSKTLRYMLKGKPVPLNELNPVEHVEGDVCRFGLRVGTIASNDKDNRTDLRASSETVKVAWVRKIRELTQGLLPLGMGLDAGALAGSSTAISISTRSNLSSSSGDRLSRDAELLSLGGGDTQRHSVQSEDSIEQGSDLWVISADFTPSTDGQLAVTKGERVEVLDEQPSDSADFVQVVVVEDPSRNGLVPCNILLPGERTGNHDDTLVEEEETPKAPADEEG